MTEPKISRSGCCFGFVFCWRAARANALLLNASPRASPTAFTAESLFVLDERAFCCMDMRCESQELNHVDADLRRSSGLSDSSSQ